MRSEKFGHAKGACPLAGRDDNLDLESRVRFLLHMAMLRNARGHAMCVAWLI